MSNALRFVLDNYDGKAVLLVVHDSVLRRFRPLNSPRATDFTTHAYGSVNFPPGYNLHADLCIATDDPRLKEK